MCFSLTDRWGGIDSLMSTRVLFGPRKYITVFFMASLLGSIIFVNSDLKEMYSSSPKRQAGVGKVPFSHTSQPYRYSPFIIDQVFNSGQSTASVFENSSDEFLRMSGPATEVFRFYASGQGFFEVNFKLQKKGVIPRTWLYNDRNQLVSAGKWSEDARGSGTSKHQIQTPGLYKLKLIFNYEHVQKIFLETTVTRDEQPLKKYILENLKTINVHLQPGQYRRIRKLKKLQELHWKKLSNNIHGRALPSPKEGILGHVKTSKGSWAVAEFKLAGRNQQHQTTYLLPSMDVQIVGGELPFGLEKFKLYPLKAKSFGMDMVMESVLEDVGLFMPRQDIAQVLLDGKFIGYYQIMEANRSHFFEYGQTHEGPIVGYDPDSLIAKKGVSHFKPRSFFKKKVYPVQKQPDPGTHGFSDKICQNDYALATSFAITYSGNHGMGAGDTRFNLNVQKNCYQPIIKDVNAGVLAIDLGRNLIQGQPPLFNGLRALGTLAPEWRPNAATYSSYFVFRGNGKTEVDKFFWWNALPSTLDWFSRKENYNNFLKYLNRWDATWSRNRVLKRLEYLAGVGHVIATANGNEMPLYTKLDYPLIQDIFSVKVFQVPLHISGQLESYPDLLYIQKAVSQLTHNSINIDNHSLAMYKWRNQALEALVSKTKSYKKFNPELVELINQDETSNVITLLFRKEHPQKTSLIFLERNNEGEVRAQASLILKDGQGHTYSPGKSLSTGQKVISLKRKDLYINDIRDNEKIRLHWFVIPKTEDYQYVRPEGRGQALYFGSHEITLLTKEPVFIQDDVSLPLNSFMVREGNKLYWREDAPHPMGPVIIPKNLEWVVKTPLAIKFGPRGCLEIHGKLSLASAATLHLTSLKDSWSGIHFLGNEDLTLARLNIEKVGTGTEQVDCNGRSYTGAVSFYDTRVALKDSKIRNIRTEDALHLFNAEARLVNVQIDTTQSDAIDGDFSYMKMSKVTLKDAGILGAGGGDGLDVSGSLVEVDQSRLSNNTDKNLSVGENSRVFVDTSFFEKGNYGIAVKDGSYLEIGNSGFYDNQKDIDAYVKKPYFPFPQIVTKENLTFNSPPNL